MIPGRPALKVAAGASLDEAARAVASQLESAGIRVTDLPEFHEVLRTGDVGRIVFAVEADPPRVVYVTNAAWPAGMAERVYEDLNRINALLGVMGLHPFYEIASASPLPAPLAPLFGEWQTGRVELFLRMAYGHETVVPPEDAPKIVDNVTRSMLAEWYAVNLADDPLATMASLETLILETLRPERDHVLALPKDAFLPEVLLLCIGCAFGASLQSMPELSAEWTRHEPHPFSLGLRCQARAGSREVVVNPIGRAFKLYLLGQEHRFTTMAPALLRDLSRSRS